ncbi:MAG: hypothetical protein IT245_08255 [Bacteroidia bacterium]|nr:hypothetical protein [Bacteroidia bacterium]
MKNIKPLFVFFIILSFLTLFLVYGMPYIKKKSPIVNPEDTKSGIDKVRSNYGYQIDSAATIYQINPAYLKALCMLECGGRKVFSQRFEPHVYRKLKSVKFNILEKYEHVTPDMLVDANDEALKNLASSWGPFQLMGYKCLQLGIKVKDIRGDNAVLYGVKWIDLTYGDYLRKGRYEDAFHIHNTGMPLPSNKQPKTYDPKYISHGLNYMDKFKLN